MITPNKPENEVQRLQSLYSMKILNTPPEERFDRFTRLAMRLFKVPIGFISMIDSERQWFKSCYGMSFSETSRDVSFCGHTILGDNELVIHDAREDVRFKDNPLVIGNPNLRFYAGYPLKSPEGYNIGTLCIADTRRRRFSAEDRQLLKDLAGLVQDEFNLVKISDMQRQLELLNQDLDETEQSQRILLETIPDGIIRIDRKGTILYANDIAGQMFGYPSSELVGRNLEILIPEYLRHLHKNGLQQYNETGKRHMESWLSVGLPGLHKEGREVPLEISFGEYLVQGERRFTGVVRDVTKQRQNEEELRKARQLAEAALVSRNDFFARMSHEIRTPLNGVVGLVDLLSETQLSGAQQNLVETLKVSAHNLLTIANDILDLGKIEAGKIRLNEVEFSVGEVLQKSIDSVLPAANSRGIRVELHLDPVLPKTFRGDPVRLHQIILNIVSNAVKFTESGSVTVSARPLRQDQQSVMVEFKIRDTGIGIKPEDLPHIFEAYAQVHYDLKEKYGGTGLGLAIVKQLVDLHKGTVDAESEIGVGTTVTVCLPLSMPKVKRGSLEIEPSIQSDASLKGKHILIVEDNAINQLVAKKAVERFGATSWEAFNALDGIAMLRREYFDLVLMDVQMPGMDGFEATRVIRKDLPRPISQIPIVAMTAAVTQETRRRCLEAGMDDYVSKPFEPSVLRAAMCRVLEEKSKRESTDSPTEPDGLAGAEAVDLSYFRGIAGNDESFVAASVRAFIEETQHFMLQLRGTALREDPGTLRSLAHKMKAVMAMVGLHQTADILKKIENDAGSDLQHDLLEDQLTIVRNSCQAAIHELRKQFPSLEQDTP